MYLGIQTQKHTDTTISIPNEHDPSVLIQLSGSTIIKQLTEDTDMLYQVP